MATAIEAIRLGAYEHLVKPLELDQLTELVDRAFEISRLMRVPAVIPETNESDDTIDTLLGNCPAMQEVYKTIGRVAPQDIALVRGESGTGKELAARAICHCKRRAKGPFLAINGTAIPEALLESELFGHEMGAFTGPTASGLTSSSNAAGDAVPRRDRRHDAADADQDSACASGADIRTRRRK